MSEQLVYLVSNEAGHVKVGVAKDVARRLTNLQIASSTDLTLVLAMPGGPGLEREIHTRWAAARLRGEWFRVTPEIAAEIDAFRACAVPVDVESGPREGEVIAADTAVGRVLAAHGITATPKALAKMLNAPASTVYTWLQKGRLPSWRVTQIQIVAEENAA